MSDFENRPNVTLSPAAQSAIDEVVKDMRDELTWRAATIADKGGSQPTVVSVLDVAAAIEQNSAEEKKLRSIMRIMGSLMAAYGVIGITLIILHAILYGDEFSPLLVIGSLSLGVSIPACTFWVMGLILGNRWKIGPPGDQVSSSDVYDFMRLWISIESTIRALYSEEFGESRSSIPVMSMLAAMEKAEMISSISSRKLNELRVARNDIVHTETPSLSRKQIKQLSHSGRTILTQLSELSSGARNGTPS
ncbi:hypothetical protein AB0D56_17950 [Streptomyces sp. NPDC048209]|uniref:hypothetical protein n=1 Tax=Streptomyces sp. NPDC048209 TaxID=3156689 RepID=UPI00343D5DA4